MIPRFPTERSCLTLLYATLITASRRRRRVPMASGITKQLEALRGETVAGPGDAVA